MGSQVLERYAWVDVAKMLCMFLVFFGHIIESTPENKGLLFSVYKYIYAFHMPLFFFLSGVTAKKPVNDFISYSLKNVCTLVIPAIAFVWMGSLFFLCESIFRKEAVEISVILKMVLSPIGGYPLAFVITWFLFCLFVSRLFFKLSYPVFEKFPVSVMMFMLLAGIVVIKKAEFFASATHIRTNFWYVHTAFLATFFLYFGHYSSVVLNKLSKFSALRVWMLLLIAVVLSWKVSMLNGGFQYSGGTVNLALMEIGEPGLFLIGALVGGGVVVLLSFLLQNILLFQRWGQLNLPLMFFAGLCMHHINSPLIDFLLDVGLSTFIETLIVLPLTFLLSIQGARLIQFWFPQLTGLPSSNGPILPPIWKA